MARFFIHNVTIIFVVSSLTYSQTQYMDFVPIDSIQSNNTHYLLARDITDDGYDDLLVCNNDGIFVYNGFDRRLFWADTIHSETARSIEIGDIEEDGQWELFVGADENNNNHLYIYPSMDVNQRFEWYGYLNICPRNVYFYREDGNPYLYISCNVGAYKLSLIDWDYGFSLFGLDLDNPFYFNESFFLTYYDWYVSYWPNPGIYYYYAAKYDLNSPLADTSLLFWRYEYQASSFMGVFGDFRAGNSPEYVFHHHVFQSNESNYLNLTLLNDQLDSIGQIEFDDIYDPEFVFAANLFDDEKDDILVNALIEPDSIHLRSILLDSYFNIYAISMAESQSNIISRCNLDYDNFDELIMDDGDWLRLYDVVFSMVSIEGNENLPLNLSLDVYPNPFNSSAVINLSVITAGHVRIDIFNILGQEVANLFDGYLDQGQESIVWNPNIQDCPSGLYFVRANTNHSYVIRKLVYLK